MSKKKRKYNPNLIRAKRSYTLTEIAQVYGLHVRTVQDWRKQGLKVIEGSLSPYLILGQDVRLFLKDRKQKQKHCLNPDQFYCTKCHLPRKSILDKLTYIISDKNLGKRYKHAIIKGNCAVCNNSLFKFSSDRIIYEMIKNGMKFEEHNKVLNGTGYPFLNTDIKEEKLNVKCES